MSQLELQQVPQPVPPGPPDLQPPGIGDPDPAAPEREEPRPDDAPPTAPEHPPMIA